MSVTDIEVEDVLKGVISTIGYGEEMPVEAGAVLDGADVRTFEESGVMTTDRGLVVRLADGSEYQLTIVRSN